MEEASFFIIKFSNFSEKDLLFTILTSIGSYSELLRFVELGGRLVRAVLSGATSQKAPPKD